VVKVKAEYSGGASEPAWQAIVLAYNATAVPILAAGTILWNPTGPGLIRALSCNDDIASPLVGGGGATTLSIGTEAIVNTFLVATALGAFATALEGWGVSGPLNSTNVGTQEAGVIVAPLGSIPGRPALQRTLRGYANLGSITGILRIRFEFRPFVGGIF